MTKHMIASELVRLNYAKFEDKKEVTELFTAIYCKESEYAKRDEDGNKLNDFEHEVYQSMKKMIKNDFTSKKYSAEIKELCYEIIENMQY
jgi:hypothetical protein